MTEQTQTNQGAGDEDEFYDDATSAFPSIEHLAPSVPPNFGAGRLVAVWAKENGSAKSATSGKDYGYTETLTLVLDDGPDGDQVNDLVPAAPQRLDLRHSTTGLYSRLRLRVEGVNAKGVPLKFRPMIGRINTQASRNNKNVPAYSIAEPTDADRAIVLAHKAEIIAINKELEAKASKSEDDAAFD